MPRRPKNNALKLLSGSRHASHGEPVKFAAAEKPRPPKWLNAPGRAEWCRLVSELGTAITTADLPALAVLAEAYGEFTQAAEHLTKEGTVIATGTGPKPNPWLKIKNAAAERVRKLSLEFGATPASRSKVELPPPVEEDEGAEFFSTRRHG